jgi:hypothetical protein
LPVDYMLQSAGALAYKQLAEEVIARDAALVG